MGFGAAAGAIDPSSSRTSPKITAHVAFQATARGASWTLEITGITLAVQTGVVDTGVLTAFDRMLGAAGLR